MKNAINKLTYSNASYGITILRIITGVVFFAHGAQKLFGAFGGYGLEGTGQFMDSIGLSPGYLMALLAGLGEFVAGILLILGLFSRVGGVIAALISVVALITVHLANGFFISNNGYEFILTLLAASIAVAIEGSGKLALDNKISQ